MLYGTNQIYMIAIANEVQLETVGIHISKQFVITSDLSEILGFVIALYDSVGMDWEEIPAIEKQLRGIQYFFQDKSYLKKVAWANLPDIEDNQSGYSQIVMGDPQMIVPAIINREDFDREIMLRTVLQTKQSENGTKFLLN